MKRERTTGTDNSGDTATGTQTHTEGWRHSGSLLGLGLLAAGDTEAAVVVLAHLQHLTTLNRSCEHTRVATQR